MKPETYMAKVRAAMGKTADAEKERLAKLAANEQRIKELEARLLAEEATKRQETIEVKEQSTKTEAKESEKMSLVLEEIASNKPNLLAPALQSSVDTAKLLAEFNQGVQLGTSQAVEKAMGYADKLSRELLEHVQKQLEGFGNPPKLIAKLVLNGREHTMADGEEISEQSLAVIARCLRLVKRGEHPLLVGPAGCGKSTLAKVVADMLDVPFFSASWTAGTNETSCLYGRQHATGFNEAGFSKAFRSGGLSLQDEIDRGDPNGICKLNAALANGHFYNEVLGEQLVRHANFGCIGTANTCGRGSDGVYVGANQLDASTIDRFVPIAVDYDAVYEKRVCPDKPIYDLLTKARAKIRSLKATEIISTRTLKKVYIESQDGTALVECIESATMGWPIDILKQTGLDSDSVVALTAKSEAKAKTKSSKEEKEASCF